MNAWRAGLLAGFAADGVLAAVVLLAGLLGFGPALPDVLLLSVYWLVYLLPFGVVVSLVLTRLRLPASRRPWLLAGASLGTLAALAGFVTRVRSVPALVLPLAAGALLGAVAAAVVRACRRDVRTV
jgi:hypothetical protein